jgi:thiamine monophosphate kinase
MTRLYANPSGAVFSSDDGYASRWGAFSDRTTSSEDAGWRAAAANLSDLAAMGATPLGITVGLGLPAVSLSNGWKGFTRV